MYLPGLCRGCGRTIEKEFVFCPWCGLSQVAGNASRVLVPVGAARQKDSAGGSVDRREAGATRLDRITRCLDDLERDFTLFMMKNERSR